MSDQEAAVRRVPLPKEVTDTANVLREPTPASAKEVWRQYVEYLVVLEEAKARPRRQRASVTRRVID